MSANPPAFPQQCADALDVGMVHEGMSLRQWYAGQALANPTICTGTAPEWELERWFKGRIGIRRSAIVAAQAFDYADAMLAHKDQQS